jgi:tetratricopeptide (TPR) repeat protein
LGALFAPTKRTPGAVVQRAPGIRPPLVAEAMARWIETELPPETVLFVDDAPRLDAASLVVTVRLSRVLTVIVTARTEELPPDHPLRAMLHDLTRERRVDRLRLERLSPDAVGALIRQLAQDDLPALSAELAQRTSGNPLFLVAALQALFEEGALYVTANGHWAHGWEGGAVRFSVPTGVREMIERRLRRLDREQRSIFDAVAVIGQDFDFALLRQVVDLEEVPLFNMLDALLDLGLVIEPRARGRGEFAPAHDVYVEVAQATLPRVRWRRLHGRVGDALQTLYPNDLALSGRLAYHYHEAERTSDAVRYAVLAGELALARYAPRQAGRHFENAAQWAAVDDLRLDPVLRAQLHVGWAEALRRSGQPQAAFDHYARALPHADAAQKLHLIYQMAALQTMQGEGPGVFVQLVDTLEADLRAPWMLGVFRCFQGYWSALRGEPIRARRCVAEGWGRLRNLMDDDGHPPWLLDRALIILARTHALWGEWRHTRRYAAHALARNVARDDVYGAADAHVTLAYACYGLGDNAAARAHAERALTEIEAAGDLRLQGKALYPLGQIMLDAAQWEDARQLIERLHLIAEQTGDLEAYARGQLLQAQLLLRTGRSKPALALLEPLLVKARAAGIPTYVVRTLRHLAEVQLALDACDAARRAVNEGVALAERCRMRHELQRLHTLSTRLPPES